MILLFSSSGSASSFVLGKQYLLKPKRQLSSLVWYAVTFDKSITGGLKVSLKVFSEKGKSLEFLDDFRDFVVPEIADRCVSKFSMTNYLMEFNEQKRSELAFQTNSINDIMYVPLKVKYENGFEDYLVRIRIKGGKFAISTRPLQHGMLTTPEENAVENYRAEQQKVKDELKQQKAAAQAKLEVEKQKEEERLKAKQEEMIRSAPTVNINAELFSTESADFDKLLQESEAQALEKEKNAKAKIKPGDESLYSQPLQTPPEVTQPTQETEKPNSDSLMASPAIMNPLDSNPNLIQSPDSQIEVNKLLREPATPTVDDDVIEIEGFDEALKEIERLESLEQ